MQTVTALVPMKHHSQRVSGKNYRRIAGKPLFHHILTTLESVPQIHEIVVDTDSPVIKKGLSNHFSGVRVLERPEDLRGDEVSMNEIIWHDLSQLDGDFFLQTHATNPLLKPESIAQAITAFFEHTSPCDSLFSVTRLYTRLWSEDRTPINHDPNQLLQTQDLPPIYEENSCLYIFSRTSFEKRGNRLGIEPLMFEIHKDEAWDIDTELDFKIAAFLLEERMRE